MKTAAFWLMVWFDTMLLSLILCFAVVAAWLHLRLGRWVTHLIDRWFE